MKAALKSLLRDPLLHFFVVGFALYGSTAIYQDDQHDAPITITADQQQELAEHFAHAYLYPPSADELAQLVEQAVADEVLYREGLRNDLARNDPIVRKRLIQKMNFLLEGAATPPSPAGSALMAFYKANKEQYQQAEKTSFQHVFFDKEYRKGTTTEDANKTLQTLQANTAASKPLGDSFIRGNSFNQQTPAQIDRTMGAGFAAQLKTAPPGQWFGPVNSVYGAHLVKVDNITEASTPPLLMVHHRVYADWQKSETEKRKDSALKAMMTKYPIVVEKFDIALWNQPQVTLNQPLQIRE